MGGTDYTKSVITGSSLHDCEGYCLNSDNGNYVDVINSVFYKGEKFLM